MHQFIVQNIGNSTEILNIIVTSKSHDNSIKMIKTDFFDLSLIIKFIDTGTVVHDNFVVVYGFWIFFLHRFSFRSIKNFFLYGVRRSVLW